MIEYAAYIKPLIEIFVSFFYTQKNITFENQTFYKINRKRIITNIHFFIFAGFLGFVRFL